MPNQKLGNWQYTQTGVPILLLAISFPLCAVWVLIGHNFWLAVAIAEGAVIAGCHIYITAREVMHQEMAVAISTMLTTAALVLVTMIMYWAQ